MLKKFIKNNLTLSLLLVLSLIIIINNFFRFFQNNSVYEFDPWLSNYQGGFVRRGIPGEIFYQIYNFLHIHPGWMVFIFVSTLYVLFYLNFFNLIKNIKINKLYIFTIFSPLAFYFPVLNSKASGHKEIIFLFFLSFFCYYLPKISHTRAYYFLILMILFLGFSHEGLIFYLTYLIIPFFLFYRFNNIKNVILYLIPILFLIIFIFLLNYLFSGNKQQVLDICNSVKDYVNNECINIGNIAHLAVTLKEYSIQKEFWAYGETSLYPDYFIIYGVGLIIGFLPMMLLYNKATLPKASHNLFIIHPLNLILLPFLITLPIYYIAADWGRYLYISYMCSLITTFFYINNNVIFIKSTSKDKKKIFLQKLYL